jgi:hypothetical protein
MGMWGFYRMSSAEVMERAERGERVDPDDLYHRASPVFCTPAPAHRWLALTVFVGLASEQDGQVCIRFFELL